MLIAAGRAGERLRVDEVCEQLKMSPQELREDISVLNVVNFGGGAYVIYAEMLPTGEIEVDPEPYSDTFDRPARLLPIEAKALVAAIDLLNLAQPELARAREKVVAALGHDPVEEGLQITSPTVADEVAHTVERAVHENRLLELEYWDRAALLASGGSSRTRCSTAREAWYVAAATSTDRLQHFRLDRIKSASRWTSASSRGPTSTRSPTSAAGRAPARSRARGSRTCGSRPSRRAGRARSGRWSPSSRTARSSSSSPFKGIDYLVKEILKEAGDAAVLEPAGRPRGRAAAAERLLAPLFVSHRRAQIAMTAEEAAAFLDEERIVTCATLGRDGWPHLMPLWYVVRDGECGRGRTRSPRRCATSSATGAARCRSRPATRTTSCAA